MPIERDFIATRSFVPMRWAQRLARPLLCVALLSLAGCGEEAVFTKVFTSEHFDYYIEQGGPPPCDGIAQWLERHYSANAKFLDATLPPGERIQYYFAQSELGLARCQSDKAAGCADGMTIYSYLPLFPHEIVHVNASLLRPPPPDASEIRQPPALFAEGLAEVLSCQSTADIEGPFEMSEPLETLVETKAFDTWRDTHGFGLYLGSASFVRFLIDKFGASPFLSFYARAPRDGSRHKIDVVFQAEFGVSLDEAFSVWRKEPRPYLGDLCLRLMECDPSMPSLTDSDATMGCGPWGGMTNEALLRFEVPNDRLLHIEMDPIATDPYPSVGVSIYRCAGGDAIGTFTKAIQARVNWEDREWHIDPGQPGGAAALDVLPGPYVAWFQGGKDTGISLDVTERLSPMRNTACEPAEEPLALDDKHPTTLATRWIERPCQGPWCPGQSWDVSIGATGGMLEAQALAFGNEPNFSPSEIYICTEPCPQDTANCEVLTLDPEGQPVRSMQTFAPGTVLHLGAPLAPFPDRFSVRLRVAPQ